MSWTTEQKIFVVEAYCRQNQIFLSMSGFRTRHIFCCQVTWTLRTTSYGVAHPWAFCAKAITLCEVHCLGCHLQTWHHWTILVRGRQRAVCDNQNRAICPGAWQVLDSTWSTERRLQGPPVVPAGWCHPPHLKRIIGMATAAFPWPTDQPQVWPAVVAAFTGLDPPDFYMWGYLKDKVYGKNPQTIPDLKTAITAAIIAIRREECGRVIENFAHRIQMCLQSRGAHLEHIFERQWNKEFLLYRFETLEMSATQAWPNVAEVLCQSK